MNVGVLYIFYIWRAEDTHKNLYYNLQVKLQTTEFPDKAAKQWEMAMPPQCRFFVTTGTLLSKDGLYQLQKTAWFCRPRPALCCFQPFTIEPFLCDERAERPEEAEASLCAPLVTAQPKPSSLAKGPQFSIRCQWVCFHHYSEKIIGPTPLTALSATPHRMWKSLRFKYFQLLKGRTCANL